METSRPAQEIPVDVLPPVPHDAHLPVHLPPLEEVKTFYHPASGITILGIDFLVFGTELFTGFLDTPLMCALAFLVTFPVVFAIQKKWGRNTTAAAFGKAFLGAFMAGLPFSIAGTIYGAAIIALSGLPDHPVEIARRFFNRHPIIDRK
jgi:hypothetical protein